ncbi:GNAT family N-acetyltransferase [Pseudalkalibacillus sp. Hm43]|uniref:GNAT family N-acetyltransferase n=1 Tax=Pseudalkalibacillus sp. Hm43 TaxID=3450742 RepID=UPI003F4383B9
MNPILREIETTLETERLILRMPKCGDGTAVNAAILASLKELKPWLPFVQTVPTVEDTELNIREAHANFVKRTSLRYLIFHKGTKEFIGSTGFHEIDWEVPKLEIGYWIDTRFSGQGYMVEAVGRLTDFALEDLGMRRVEIQCESENKKSRSIPERLGYTLEGIMRNDDVSVDGERLTDTCIYSRIN